MEVLSEGLFWGCAVCTLVVGLYVWLWDQGGGGPAGVWAAATLALEGQLYAGGFHGVFGVLTLCCCGFAVHHLTQERRCEFLPMHGKSVLITGRDYFFINTSWFLFVWLRSNIYF